MPHVTLRDVAARAGVSIQTTSKVLNGKGTVAAETRQRILASAAELGYVPNALARGLLTQRTFTIGVVATDFTDTTLLHQVIGIEREARRHDLLVIVGSIDPRGSDAEQYIRVLVERRVDGIIAVAPATEDNAEVGKLLRGRVPTVSTHNVVGDGISIVTPDNHQTAYLPSRHLAALGHQHIGTITGPRNRRVTHVRLRGYCQALAEAGIPYAPERVEEADWTIEGGYEAAHRLLDRCPRLTAIYVQNDMMAVGVLSALHDRGRRVPEDCAVAACDDLPIAARTIPPLTTVHVPFHEVGETAVRLLLDCIAGRTAAPQRILLPVRMVYRASCQSQQADRAQGPLTPSDTVPDPA